MRDFIHIFISTFSGYVIVIVSTAIISIAADSKEFDRFIDEVDTKSANALIFELINECFI